MGGCDSVARPSLCSSLFEVELVTMLSVIVVAVWGWLLCSGRLGLVDVLAVWGWLLCSL